MAEKGFYSWQAARNILRIIKVSCSCRIMHIIMARGFTLMCLGGGYYFRTCIHIWMELEFFTLIRMTFTEKVPGPSSQQVPSE